MRIFLEYAPTQTEIHRARLSYAFSLFCAIYGHQPIFRREDANNADVVISYAPSGAQDTIRPILQLSDLYQLRSPDKPAPPPNKFELAGVSTAVFFAPLHNRHPDWLAEIFEWVSCADEYSVAKRDVVGRVPFAQSYVGRHRLDPQLPYGSIAMQLLQRSLCELVPGASAEPVSPVSSVRHFVICTHDIDFVSFSNWSALRRLVKNSCVSLLLYRSPRLALYQARKSLLTLTGVENPFKPLDHLARTQLQRGCKASYFFIPEHHHRRDANYRINDPKVLHQMRSLEHLGMEVGVHGSYTSLDDPQGLADEFARLQGLGFHPRGGRQHWLRFTVDRLIDACERAEVLYDTSLGWTECIGFRGGACFAFPPYNFRQERAANFLEIPLVVMDGSLPRGGDLKQDWYDNVAQILSTSRRHGWGGISVLWHNTAFDGNQLPPSIGEIYWELVDHREEWKDTWISAADFTRSVRQRYVEVGLMPAENGGTRRTCNAT